MNAEFDETAIRALCDAYKDIQTRYRDELTIDELWDAIDPETRLQLIRDYFFAHPDARQLVYWHKGNEQTELMEKSAFRRGDIHEAADLFDRAMKRWGEVEVPRYMSAEDLVGKAYRRVYQEAA